MEGRFYTLHMNKILYINNCFCRKKINDVFWDPLGKKNQSHIISAAALSIPVRNEVKYSGWPTGDYRPPSLYTPHIHTHARLHTRTFHAAQHKVWWKAGPQTNHSFRKALADKTLFLLAHLYTLPEIFLNIQYTENTEPSWTKLDPLSFTFCNCLG